MNMIKAYLSRILTGILNPLDYIKARLLEPSTWAGIITGIVGANALNHPWDYVSAAAGAIMALLPAPKKPPVDGGA